MQSAWSGITVLALAVVVSPAGAQRLRADGQWSATVTSPGGTATPATAEVIASGDSTSPTFIHPAHGRFLDTHLRFDGDTLRFSWTPGTAVECPLTPRPRVGYGADCLDGDGQAGQATLRPPAP